ncbi:MAG: helix-turn-helix domain-containing protein [Ignavibacteria bacterium]|nr:helix-turn-helix domain-containing protein [Ignavibacteria bacterium]
MLLSNSTAETSAKLLFQLTELDLSAIVRREITLALSSQTSAPIPIEPKAKTELLTREQVRELFGVSLPTLNSWNKLGVLPCLHFGRSVRYNKAAVEKLLLVSKKGVTA